jgi:hypothetical protein
VFRVPVFARTELFNSHPDPAELNRPFATIVEVFRTTDGRPLDKQAVIAFYRDALQHNGWKQGIFNRKSDEAYLSMPTDVVEALPDGTRIQIAGDFSLWVAPGRWNDHSLPAAMADFLSRPSHPRLAPGNG